MKIVFSILAIIMIGAGVGIYFHVNNSVLLAIITPITGGVVYGLKKFFDYDFMNHSKEHEVILNKLEDFGKDLTKVMEDTSNVSKTLDLIVNTSINIDEYTHEVDAILDAYSPLVSGKYKQFMVAKFNSMKSILMKIHEHGFYNIKGEPLEVSFGNIITQIEFQVKKIEDIGKTLLGNQAFQEFEESHTQKTKLFLEDLKVIFEDTQNSKHQRIQRLFCEYIKNSLIAIINFANRRV